jgi:hypothetical protein
VPGATSSGLISKEESVLRQIEGPLLDEGAMLITLLGLTLTLPVQNTLTSLMLIFLGEVMVEAPDPLFPAEKTTAMPAADKALKRGI